MTNGVKTVFLLSLMSVLLWQVSILLFETGGALIGIGLAFVLNIGAYFFSDKLALAASRAKPVTEQELPDVYRIMRTLTDRLQIPMPRIFLIDAQQPNAFATGRNPKHAVVAVTSGILSVLNQDELEGVLAHELAHVTNRDILISSIAAMMGAALSILSRMAMWGGGGRRRDNGGTAVLALVGMLVGPLLAALLRFAISRSREFQADESGAAYTGNPLALASALRKIAGGVDQQPMRVNEAVATMYIENPLRGPRGRRKGSARKLFSTHPPMEERVKRLESMVGPISG